MLGNVNITHILGGLYQRLEAKVGLVVLGNLADKALERQLAEKQIGGRLVLADLLERNGSFGVSHFVSKKRVGVYNLA